MSQSVWIWVFQFFCYCNCHLCGSQSRFCLKNFIQKKIKKPRMPNRNLNFNLNLKTERLFLIVKKSHLHYKYKVFSLEGHMLKTMKPNETKNIDFFLIFSIPKKYWFFPFLKKWLHLASFGFIAMEICDEAKASLKLFGVPMNPLLYRFEHITP